MMAMKNLSPLSILQSFKFWLGQSIYIRHINNIGEQKFINHSGGQLWGLLLKILPKSHDRWWALTYSLHWLIIYSSLDSNRLWAPCCTSKSLSICVILWLPVSVCSFSRNLQCLLCLSVFSAPIQDFNGEPSPYLACHHQNLNLLSHCFLHHIYAIPCIFHKISPNIIMSSRKTILKSISNSMAKTGMLGAKKLRPISLKKTSGCLWTPLKVPQLWWPTSNLTRRHMHISGSW